MLVNGLAHVSALYECQEVFFQHFFKIFVRFNTLLSVVNHPLPDNCLKVTIYQQCFRQHEDLGSGPSEGSPFLAAVKVTLIKGYLPHKCGYMSCNGLLYMVHGLQNSMLCPCSE